MSYTFPSATINNVTYTALRWGQFPTITYAGGGTAGSETVAVASDLSNVTVTIQSGVSTNSQIVAAIASRADATVNSLQAADLVSPVIAGGHGSDTASTVGATSLTGASSVPPPDNVIFSDKSASGQPPSVVLSSTVIDWSVAGAYSQTLSANTTFSFVNNTDGVSIAVILTNTASNYTVTWPAGIKWSGGSAPTQTVGAKSDAYTFTQVGSVIYGIADQNLF